MYLFVFQSKLRRLNPLLYVDVERSTPVPNSDWRVAPIRIRKQTNSAGRRDSAWLDGEAAEYLDAHERGQVDEVVGGCPTNWVPEGDFLDPKAERPRLLARGWRSILLTLAKRRLVDLGRARQIFECGSLGQSTYDQLSLKDKWLAELPHDKKELFCA